MTRPGVTALALACALLLTACGGSTGGSGGGGGGSTAEQLASLKARSIYFGHQSVGTNIMEGVNDWLAQVPSADRLARSGDLSAAGVGTWVDGTVGSNYDPLGKISDFQAKVIAHCSALDVAFMKLCFVDSSYFGGHSAESLLAAYDAMVAAVHSACPGVTLVHLTMPLEVSYGNAVREQYNALVRAEYGSAVFDVALEESTAPDGSRCRVDGVPALCGDYAGDTSGHLSVTGRDRIAARLIAMLAALP